MEHQKQTASALELSAEYNPPDIKATYCVAGGGVQRALLLHHLIIARHCRKTIATVCRSNIFEYFSIELHSDARREEQEEEMLCSRIRMNSFRIICAIRLIVKQFY